MGKNNCTYSRKHTKTHTHQPTTLYTVNDPNKERHTERLFNIKHSLYLIMLICSIRISSSKITTTFRTRYVFFFVNRLYLGHYCTLTLVRACLTKSFYTSFTKTHNHCFKQEKNQL